MYLKSLNLTFKADNHKPAPKAAIKATAVNKGSISIFQSGQKSYQAIIPMRITKEIKKSTKQTITAEVGTIIRGKYILETILALAITELLDSDNELAKNCQGSMPAKTIIAYGAAPSVGILASLPKTTVKTIAVSKGRRTAHAIPITVCL